MAFKRRKKTKTSFLLVGALIVLAFGLNWFLNHRLESFLKSELSNRVSEATDGFYDLSFEHLSVGFFSGELLLKGVELQPDSAVFEQWAAKDSLPDTYVKLSVASIKFEGINLVWRLNYKKLNFDLFEIVSPQIEVYESFYSARFKKKTRNTDTKTLFQMMEPYINVLAVKELDVENISVSYNVEDPATSAIYALKNANFHAYGFRLDKDSQSSGKLLYCNQFDFSANTPQVLLSNRQFMLNTDSISLSTQDSIVHINGINLLSRDSLWFEKTGDSHLNAKVEAVKVEGVYFKRENALTYLNARLFDIIEADIEYFAVDKEETPDKQQSDGNDSLSWTLHEIISPVLYSVAVDEIGIDKARFKYSVEKDKGTDEYLLDRLDFRANGFLVDSLSGVENRFLYSIDYMLDATGISGQMNSNNHNLKVGHVLLDTKNQLFRLKNVDVSPISTAVNSNYFKGTIDSISIDGMLYDKGLTASRLSVDSPDVLFVKNRKSGGKAKNVATEINKIEEQDAPEQMVSVLGFLKIGNILLNNANLRFKDNVSPEKQTYRLRNFYFYATDFLIDESTRNSKYGFFDCRNFGFRFVRFDNILPGGDYRLSIGKASYVQQRGQLELHDVKLTPQTETWKKSPDMYIDLAAPLIYTNGFSIEQKLLRNKVFNLTSPQLKIVRERLSADPAKKKEAKDDDSFLSLITTVMLDAMDFDDAHVNYLDKVTGDSLDMKMADFKIRHFSWDTQGPKKIGIGELTMQSPHIYLSEGTKKRPVKNGSTNSSESAITGLFDFLDIGKISFSDAHLAANFSDTHMSVDLKSLLLSGLKWTTGGKNSSFSLDKIAVVSPAADILSLNPTKPTDSDESKKNGNLYTVLDKFAKKISLNNFSVEDASVDYSTAEKEKDRLNKSDLFVEGLEINTVDESFEFDDIRFNTKNLKFPVNDGFYTVKIDSIGLSMKDPKLYIGNLHMESRYPKMEYAYKHPRNKDWFDVTMANATLSGINFQKYFAEQVFEVSDVKVNDVVLQNFKNQKIKIQHNIMPLIYEGLQKSPLKFDIKNADVSNFTVSYEELPKDAATAGLVLLSGLNGHLDGLTNIVSHPDQYIKLNAEGYFMGSGYFTASWDIPVDSLNDCFVVDAHIHKLDLKEMNRLITPLAGASVETGVLKDTRLRIEASSEEARIDMLMLYNDLKINVLKGKDENAEQNKFVTFLANKIIKKDNPRKRKAKPEEVHIAITRDPYHSTFNYFWQAIQPALVESVGVSQGKQNFGKKVMNIVGKVKNFFSRKKDDNKPKE